MPHIALHGARNVRDLGDFVTADGRKIARGRLLRGDALAALDDDDVAVLAGMGVRTVVDFRGPREVETYGADRLPPGTSVIALPVTGGDIGAMLSAAAGDTAFGSQRALLGDGKAAAMMIQANRRFVSDPGYRAAFGAAFRVIADAERAPALFHCTAGKDRTGWMTAVLLTALGVPHETVVADYMATNDYVASAYSAWLDKLVAAGTLAEIDLIRPLLLQDPAYLEAAFDEVDMVYGSFDRFLADGLGIGAAELAGLREAVLD
jgi:protein-tyrosine phosphatase